MSNMWLAPPHPQVVDIRINDPPTISTSLYICRQQKMKSRLSHPNINISPCYKYDIIIAEYQQTFSVPPHPVSLGYIVVHPQQLWKYKAKLLHKQKKKHQEDLVEWLHVHSKEKPLSQPSSTASLLDAMDVAAALSCMCQLNMGITYSRSSGSLNCQLFSCTDQWWTIMIQCMYEDSLSVVGWKSFNMCMCSVRNEPVHRLAAEMNVKMNSCVFIL